MSTRAVASPLGHKNGRLRLPMTEEPKLTNKICDSESLVLPGALPWALESERFGSHYHCGICDRDIFVGEFWTVYDGISCHYSPCYEESTIRARVYESLIKNGAISERSEVRKAVETKGVSTSDGSVATGAEPISNIVILNEVQSCERLPLRELSKHRLLSMGGSD